MRVGLVAARYAPEFEGGSERIVRALARGLLARGHEVIVVCGTDRRDAERELWRESLDGIEVVRIPLREGEVLDLELARPRVESLVSSCLAGCDIVHLHHWSTLSQRLARVLAPEHPVLVTLHDAFATCPRFFRSSPLGIACPPRGEFEPCARCIQADAQPFTLEQLESRLARRARDFEAEIGAARRWIVPSRFQGKLLLAHLALDPARQVVLAPGLTRALRRRARPKGFARELEDAKAPFRCLRLLHFGNLCAEKGTFDLVEAMAMLPDGVASLTVMGRALTPDFEARVERLRGSASVRILGPYDSRALARAAEQADLAVFPTRLPESYGLVLDEAHALGLPAWTSDRGAMPERLVGGERSLPAGNPRAWADALAEQDSNFLMLSMLAHTVPYLDVLSVGFSVRAHEELYLRVLSGARA